MTKTTISGIDKYNTLGVDVFKTQDITITITHGRYANKRSVVFSEDASLIKGAKQLRQILNSEEFDLLDEEELSIELAKHILSKK